MTKKYQINPFPKPRMTRSDRWKKRPCVVRYHEFKDQVRASNIQLSESGLSIIFEIKMPKSWSKKQKEKMNGMAHKQKPDLDNLLKALFDAVYEEDSHIWNYEASKVWAYEGGITVEIKENK